MTLRSEILTDLDTIFDTDNFAEEATLSGGEKVYGIVHEPFEESLGVNNASLTFTGKSSALSGLANGNSMVINSVTYYVIGIEPNRIGMTTVRLSR